MIVVDTNIISYLLLPTAHTIAAEKLFQDDPEWTAPVLWRSEFRNVLALYLRRKLVALDEALTIQAMAEDLMREGEYEVPSSQVLSLVASSTCSAYDCEFVALAKALGTRLVTADKALVRSFPKDTLQL